MPLKVVDESPAILKQARWIWPENMHWDMVNCYALFRHAFSLPNLPARAPFFITADQSYQLYINGKYVACGPARGFQKTWPYDELDVRPWLKKGKNLIAVRAHNPGFSNFQYVNQGFAGLLIAAKWGATAILTDDTWKARRQSGVRRDMVPTSLQLFPQESIDLNIESPDWMLPSFDDSSWKSIVHAAPWNSMPWASLQRRGIPQLEENEIRPGTLIGSAHGKSSPLHLSTRNLAINRFEEGLAHQPAASKNKVLYFESVPRGEWRSQLIDLGKLYIGSVVLEIENARGGEIVETHHYETIDAQTLTPDFLPIIHCRPAFSNRMVCRPGHNLHSFYHSFGSRYMIVTVRANKTPLRIKHSLRTAFYPLQEKGKFLTSDSTLNSIWKICAWTQRVCSLDTYVDTPWREQAQWWGDARVQGWNTFYLDGDTRLFRRGIRQIASQSTPDGITYGHAPTIAHNCILPDFTLIWMLTIWDYYWQSGSLEAFQHHQPEIRKALAYFKSWISVKTGLLTHDSRYWLFLDWTGLRSEGSSSVYNLWMLQVLDKLTQLYTLSGNRSEAADCGKWAASLRKGLRRLINKQGLMTEGLTPTGKIDPAVSIHAQTLAIMNGLAPEHEKAMLEKSILPYLRGELDSKTKPSAYWITYVYSVLVERGFASDVVAHISKNWAPMIEQGSTWESFNPLRGDGSHSHAWSAHPLFHLMQSIGGIRPLAPGWKEVNYQPLFQGDHADVTFPSPLGELQSSWKKDAKGITAKLKIPRGMRARIRLPKTKVQTIIGPASKTFRLPLPPL